MSHGFDPYHTWLGIPAEEQPPNHYRLLGLRLFESDPEVIQNAVDQRMAYLKSLATGAHGVHSQQLLNVVSRAGTCLLRPEAKRQYDGALRAGLAVAARNAPRPIRQTLAPPPTPTPSPGGFAGTRPSPISQATDSAGIAINPATKRGRGKKKSASSSVLIVQIVVSGLIGLAAACFILFLVNPKHPLLMSFANALHPEEVVEEPIDTAPSEKPESKQASASAPSKSPATTTPSPIESPPSPLLPGSIPENPPDREEYPFNNDARTPSPVDDPPAEEERSLGDLLPSNPENDSSSATTTDARKTLVLDLSKGETTIELPEVAPDQEVSVRVGDATNLRIPFSMEPCDGVLGWKQPLKIILQHEAGIEIWLGLDVRREKVVFVAKLVIGDGQGGKGAYTLQRSQNYVFSTRRTAKKIAQQLAAAEAQSTAINRWLSAPGPKPLVVRNEKRKQRNTLNHQIIPGLKKQFAQAQQ